MPRASTSPNYCLCGCGNEISPTAHFVRGHQVGYRRTLERRVINGDLTAIPLLRQFNWEVPNLHAPSFSGAASTRYSTRSNNTSAQPRSSGRARPYNPSFQTPARPIAISPEDRTFGIEIEFLVESLDKVYQLERELQDRGINTRTSGYTHAHTSYWKIVTDGSLRPADTYTSGGQGRELVSPVLSGEDGMNQVKKVCEALSAVGAKVNKSCGFHVHVGASDFTINHARKLFEIYATNEPFIDTMVPRSRRGDDARYCKSMVPYFRSTGWRSANSINALAEALGDRYRKLNFHAFTRHGTVEFRQHSGTIEYGKMSNWISVCRGMTNWAVSSVPASADFNTSTKLTVEQIAWWDNRIQQLARAS